MMGSNRDGHLPVYTIMADIIFTLIASTVLLTIIEYDPLFTKHYVLDIGCLKHCQPI